MSDTGQPEDGRCKHVITEQLGTRFLTRKEAAILRRRPKKEIPAHEPSAGTEGDAMARVKAVYPGAFAVCSNGWLWSIYPALGEGCINSKDDTSETEQAAWEDAASKLPQPSRPEHGLPELMHADAVTKLELWKQNQALLQQLKALKQSHAALVKALEKIVRIMGDLCPYAGECANHSSGDCIECTARAALADAEKVTG